MNVRYYHKNIDSLSNATKEYIEQRMKTLGDVRRIGLVRVELDQTKQGDFHMSIQVNSGSHVYYASARNSDVNACAEEIRGELRKQMLSDKGKIRDLVRRGARSLKKKLTISDDARL